MWVQASGGLGLRNLHRCAQVIHVLPRVKPHLASAPEPARRWRYECHLRWKTDSLAAGPRLCSAHGGPVGIVSFMTGAHLSKTVSQSWVQGSREGAGGTAVSHCPHFCSEGVLGAEVTTLCHSYLSRCCCQSHREVIWLIIPVTIEWGPCLPEGGELTPQ